MNYFIFKFTIFLLVLTFNLIITCYISNYILQDPYNHTIDKYIIFLPIYLAYLYYLKLLTKRMITSNESYLFLKGIFLSTFTIFGLTFLFKVSEEYSRLVLILFFIINFISPIYIYFIKRYFMRYKFLREDIFVVCDSSGMIQVKNWFKKDNAFGFDVKRVINIDKRNFNEIKQEIKEVIEDERYHAAIIDLEERSNKKVFLLIDIIQHHINRIIIMPKLSKFPVFNGEVINSINHKGMAFYIKNNLLNPVDKRIKSIFDYVMSISLIFIFLPFLLILYIIVYIDTKGKPIFKQRRIGQNGKSFNIYKFRTMVANSDKILQDLLENNPEIRDEWEKEFKLKNDPRITKLGNFLRKTSLDELPQLINVFQGKMSLVGPRPIIKKEIEKYGNYFEYFKLVKPGITGLWQVSGRNDIDYDERVQLDVWYSRNWSIELDFIILIKTVVVVLFKKGSY